MDSPEIAPEPFVVEKARKLFAALGDAPIEIAQTLTDAGIVGYLCHPRQCPIAVYLKSEGIDASVGVTMVVLAGPADIDLPAPVQEFVREFDRARFSWLIKKGSCR